MAMPWLEIFGVAAALFTTTVCVLCIHQMFEGSRRGRVPPVWWAISLTGGLLFGCALLTWNLTRLWMALHNIHH